MTEQHQHNDQQRRDGSRAVRRRRGGGMVSSASPSGIAAVLTVAVTTRPTVKVSALLPVLLAVAVIVGGCTSSSSAAHATATLKSLRGMDILTTPPAHGKLLGNSEDRGSNSSITGRSPGITSVFATTVFPRAIEAYYQSVYRKYRLSEDCCATAHHIQLVGATPTATIGIDITTGKAHIPEHYTIHPKAAPHGATTWATVQVTATG